MLKLRGLVPLIALVSALLLTLSGAFAQETTGGIVGTVKDPSGGVMPGVKVEVTGDTLVGSKEATTDNAGYYRFVNLPPGKMTITVTAPGFATFKRDLVLEVGHLPMVDITLQVGRTETVVEVSGSTPVIDPTTNVTTTNLTEKALSSIPHGLSFQSIIQFAPAARNEPLMGTNTTIAATSFGAASSNGTGGGLRFAP